MSADWRDHLERLLPRSRARRDVPLRELTTLRIGGPADALVDLESEQELADLMDWLEREGIPFAVLGKGSNLLAADAGLRGVAIRLGRGLSRFEALGEQGWVRAGAGLANAAFVSLGRRLGLGGMEFLVAIPGTLGGALAMNAGAHDGETARWLEQVRLYERGRGIGTRPAADFSFGYRASPLRGQLGRIVIAAVFRMLPMAPETIRAHERQFQEYRRRTQPREHPNCGSVFANPPGGFAGQLIERAGLKGRSVGGAWISEKHANFIVNRGAATAADVLELIDMVWETVYQQSDVKLKLELQIMDERGGFRHAY